MTNEDRIKGHFSAIAECTGNLRRNYDPERGVENDEVAQYLQKQLDAIRSLIGMDEPESPASSVLRLTDLCNRLEAENHTLKTDLARTEALLVIADEKLAQKNQCLRHAEERLKGIKHSLKNRSVEVENRRLRRQLAKAYNQVKGLQRTLEEMGLS